MRAKNRSKQAPAARTAGTSGRRREPILAQLAGFVDLFVWLLVLKTFFLPLFVIPTGSMAETLNGAHATHTCPNCGSEYTIGFHDGSPGPVVQCPNCRYREFSGDPKCPHCTQRTVQPTQSRAVSDRRAVACSNPACQPRYGAEVDNAVAPAPIKAQAGDRIVVHGWPFDFGGALGPRRWDVVVFKVPKDGQTNYIKRLIGLPGETIEVIDGDVFVSDPDSGETHIARKTRHAQDSLWFPYYDHDQRPRRASVASAYHPRWVTSPDGEGWSGLETRTARFDGLERARSSIHFATAPGDDASPGEIVDIYGYNGPGRGAKYVVNDVRLSAEVTLEAGEGYIELSSTKFADRFYARLYADGRVTLEHARGDETVREVWGETRLAAAPRGVRFALANVDYVVSVEIEGEPLIQSTAADYDIDPERARKNADLAREERVPWLRIAAEDVQASLTHLLIERDVYYTRVEMVDRDANGRAVRGTRRPGHGVDGNAIQLGDEYFVMGDNSPASLDSRLWRAETLGPHLREAYRAGKYKVGTVPADQMIGRAFFVYWPGFLPLYPGGPNLLPDLGRVRWIH